MRLLIVGRNGRLAKELIKTLGSEHGIHAMSRDDFEFFGHTHMVKMGVLNVIRSFSPDCIINAMAMNGMEACEDLPSDAIYSNTQLPAILAECSKQNNIPFIHFSTDYVAAMNNQVIQEQRLYQDGYCGFYGQTKSWGEFAVASIAKKYLIFRVSSIYTHRDLDGALGPIKRLVNNQPIGAVLQQACSPTPTKVVAEAIRAVLKRLEADRAFDFWGLYHISCKGHTTKRVFAERAIEHFLDRNEIVVEGTLPKLRPQLCALETTMFRRIFSHDFPSWYNAMKDEAKAYRELNDRNCASHIP